MNNYPFFFSRIFFYFAISQACATDTKYFDEEFTSQTPKDSYVEAKPLSEASQLAFNGFR